EAEQGQRQGGHDDSSAENGAVHELGTVLRVGRLAAAGGPGEECILAGDQANCLNHSFVSFTSALVTRRRWCWSGWRAGRASRSTGSWRRSSAAGYPWRRRQSS